MATQKSKSTIKKNRAFADAMSRDSNMGMSPGYQAAKKKTRSRKK